MVDQSELCYRSVSRCLVVLLARYENRGNPVPHVVAKIIRRIIAFILSNSQKVTRRYGADLCYTPMYNSKLWAAAGESAGTKGEFYTVPEDRPLLVQAN